MQVVDIHAHVTPDRYKEAIRSHGSWYGLGPEVGRRAVALRDGDGPFKSIEDFRFRLNLTMDAIIRITPYVSVISMSTKAAGGSGTKTGGRIVDA